MKRPVDDGYELGPDATVRALRAAWAAIAEARSVVLVEGVSDQVALDATARALDLDLGAARTLVMPIGGAQAVERTVAELDTRRGDLRLVGLCDIGEASFFRRTLPDDRIAVCDPDLETELIRAAGADLIESVIDRMGEKRAFRTLQAQAPWRDAAHADQCHRFIRSRSGRGQRYAQEVLRMLDPALIPAPLRRAVELAVA